MNNTDLIRLRSKIVALLAGMENTTANTRSALKESSEVNPNFLQDESDSAKGELDLKNALHVHNNISAQQRLLCNALNRMDGGTYGICEGCDEEIAMRRLEAMPGAAYCIQCQGRHERGIEPDPRSLVTPTQIRWAA